MKTLALLLAFLPLGTAHASPQLFDEPIQIIDTIVGEGFPGEGLSHEPAAALAVGAVYIVGLNGDVDPGRVMYGPEVYNLDTTGA